MKYTLVSLVMLGLNLPVQAQSVAPYRVLGPYVSGVDPAQPVIVLHTEAEVVVEFAVSNPTATTQHSSGHRHVFDATPGQAYTIRVDGTSIASGSLRALPPDNEPWSFVVVGDAQNARDPSRRRAVMHALETHDPSFILHTGDLHNGKGGPEDSHDLFGEDWRINFFDPMPPLQRSVPFFPVFGNHDDELEGQRESFFQAFPGWPTHGCYDFQAGPVAFFFLDIQNQIREFFRKGQDQWLREAVDRHPDALWRVAIFHVPPWSGGHRGEREWTVGQRERLLAVFQELGIDLVFNGHDHNYQRMRPLGLTGVDRPPVQFVTSGVAGANFYMAEDRDFTVRVVNRRDHFVVVDVEQDQLTLRAIAVDGEEMDAFTLHREPRRTTPFAPLYEISP